MVTTKRQINKERDRFGGFDIENKQTLAPIAFDDHSGNNTPSDISSIQGYAHNSSIVISDPEPQQAAAYMSIVNTPAPAAPAPEPAVMLATPAQKPLYSTRETLAAEPVAELPKRSEKEKKPFEKEDLMPSIKTRALVNEKISEDEVAVISRDRRERTALSPKTKVMLVVYLVVALALAIAVIATGVSISHATAASVNITAEISQKQTRIAAQESRIAELTDEATIRIEAAENGMVDATEPQYYVAYTEQGAYPMPVEHTNAFDAFCDWLGGILM